MCRSQGEPHGPKRCPAHARIQLEKSVAVVKELEAREAQFRAALAVAMAKTQDTHRAVEHLKSLERELHNLEASLEDDPEDNPDYLALHQEIQVARRRHDAARPASSSALSVLDQRRRQAAEALATAGVSAAAAGQHLNDIEVETGFAPPF